MNHSLNTLSNAITSPTPPQSDEVRGISLTTQVTYSIICTTAILGNTLTIIMFVLERMLLKKTHSVLILTLAIADVLTAINVITSPTYVLGDAFPTPANPVLGEIFCRLIWSHSLIFNLVFFSVYITLALTVERWFAVVKPHKYSDVFTRRRVFGYIFFCWAWSFFLTAGGVVQTIYTPSDDKICEIRIIAKGSFLRIFIAFIQSAMRMIFPCLLMIGLYIHMIVKTTNSPAASAESKAKLRGKMTRMIAATSVILFIFLVPSQVTLLLIIAGNAEFGGPAHNATSLLTFITTCINPFIYGLSNANYRHRYRKILFSMCPRVLREGARVENIEVVNRVGRWRVHPSKQESNLDQAV